MSTQRGPAPADLRLLASALCAWAVLALTLAADPWVRVFSLGVVGLLTLGAVALRARRGEAKHGKPPGIPRVVALAGACVLLLQVATIGHQALRATGPLAALTAERAMVTVTGRVATDPRALMSSRGQSTIMFRVDASSVSGRGQKGPAHGPVVVRGTAALAKVPWGATVELTGRLSPTEPGVADVAALRVSGPATVIEPPDLVARGAERLRAGLRDSVAHLPPDARGLVPGLVIGDTSQLPTELDDAMRATGMTHLTAVSGSNVSLVLALVLVLCRWVGVPRAWRPWLALLALAGFVVLARPEPSVVRAATMGAIGVIGLSRHRHAAGLPVLGATVLVVLCADPWLSRSYGFALSTLATLGLLVFAGPWGAVLAERAREASNRLRRLRALRPHHPSQGRDTSTPVPALALPTLPPSVQSRLAKAQPSWSGVGTALAVPLAAQVMCAPVIVLLQSSVSVIGVLANLLAAPLVPLTTFGGIGVAGLALIWPAAAQWLAWVPALPALGIGRIGRVLADVPGGTIPWPEGAPGALALAALTVVLLLCGRHLSWLVGRRPLVALAALLLAAAVLTPTRVVTWPVTGWAMVSCDIGQGDATVLRSGPHRAVVVDTGPDPDLIDGCLDRLDIDTVDAVVLTHFHVDHTGGLDGVSRGRSIDALLVSWVAEPPDIVAGVQRWSAEHGIPSQPLHARDTLRFGSLQAEVWWPQRRISAGSIPNNSSVVLAVETDDLHALLLGDLEREACAALAGQLRRDPALAAAAARFDVVKSPHHGSANIDPALLTAVRAPVAVISVGADNDYGHPAPSHVSLLRNLGYAVHRTDLDGDIALVPGPQGVHVVTAK